MRLLDPGRPSLRYAASASPTSVGSGMGSGPRPLPRIVSWPLRQSMSSSKRRSYLLGAQAQSDEQHQDRVVTSANGGVTVAVGQNALNLRLRQRLGDRRKSPARDPGNARRKIAFGLAAEPQVAQEASKAHTQTAACGQVGAPERGAG